MSKHLLDLKNDNLYLFNLLFRHQVYLEGVKAGFARNYKKMLTDLYDEFAKYFGKTEYNSMDDFTRVELHRFIQRFLTAQDSFYSTYTQQLIELLKAFIAVDVDVSNAIYVAATGKSTTERADQPKPADNPPTLALYQTSGTEAGNDALWATIADTIIPANGLTIPEMLEQFGNATKSKVSMLMSRAYANGDTMRDTMGMIVGTRSSNFKDGLFATFSNQNNALIATAIQHASSILQAGIASVHFNQYVWVAILDGKTTVICRNRDGNIYVYGEGPLPPAHYFCRSKAVALYVDGETFDTPNTFYDWLTTQPDEVIADMLGQAIAAQIIAGDPKIKGISITDSVSPLTLSAFRSKINLITL